MYLTSNHFRSSSRQPPHAQPLPRRTCPGDDIFLISNLLTLIFNYFGLPQIITLIADGLYSRRADILEANKLDLAKAERDGVTGPLFDR